MAPTWAVRGLFLFEVVEKRIKLGMRVSHLSKECLKNLGDYDR